MEEENAPKKRNRNIINLILGIAFLGYGCYRLYTYLNGVEYTTFRLLISIGFVILGIVDLYKYFGPKVIN